MATYSFHRLIMGKVEIGNFYCLIGDNRILFLQKCLLNSSSHFIRLLSELLNLIGCRGNINSLIFEKNLFLKNHKYIKYMFMALVTSLVVLFYCCVTADILTKLLQQCFLIFIVIPPTNNMKTVYPPTNCVCGRVYCFHVVRPTIRQSERPFVRNALFP